MVVDVSQCHCMFSPRSLTLMSKSNNGLGCGRHGYHPTHCRNPGQICPDQGTSPTSLRRWSCDLHFPLHCYFWSYVVDDTLALPYRNIPSKRTCERWRLVCRWLVDWKRCHYHDHSLSLPSYKLRDPTLALRAQHLLPAIRDTYVP